MFANNINQIYPLIIITIKKIKTNFLIKTKIKYKIDLLADNNYNLK